MSSQGVPLQRLRAILLNPTLQTIVAIALWIWITFQFNEAPAALRWPARLVWMIVPIWLVARLVRVVITTRFTWKKTLFILIIASVQYVAVAMLCNVFIALMSQKDDRLTTRGATTLSAETRRDIRDILDGKRINVIDAELGWRMNPDAHSPNYVINKQGFRGPREYPQTPPDPAKRILCLGDSFTFGTAVADDETFEVHAERLLPGTEWLNFGVPGTCLTQSYLLYKSRARQFGGKYVIIGFMSNDAMRTVNCFRPFVNVDSASPLTKPFVRLRDGKLSLEPNPYKSADDYRRLLDNDREELDKLRRLDYLSWSREHPSTNPILRTLSYIVEANQLDRNFDSMFTGKLPLGNAIAAMLPQDPYGKAIYEPTSEGFAALTALFDRYHDEVVADGRIPLIVLFPGPLDVDDAREREPCQYASLTRYLRSKNYAVLDFLEPLIARHAKELNTQSLFVKSHYQPHINKEVAVEIIKALRIEK